MTFFLVQNKLLLRDCDRVLCRSDLIKLLFNSSFLGHRRLRRRQPDRAWQVT